MRLSRKKLAATLMLGVMVACSSEGDVIDRFQLVGENRANLPEACHDASMVEYATAEEYDNIADGELFSVSISEECFREWSTELGESADWICSEDLGFEPIERPLYACQNGELWAGEPGTSVVFRSETEAELAWVVP